MKRINNFLYSLFILFFAYILFSYPVEIFISCKDGLIFWYRSIIPSLFPFMILSGLLLESKLVILVSRIFSPITRLLFNISGEGSIAFLLGSICGFPLGAKVTTDLKNKNIISDVEASRLISFCNNCSPMFIINVACLTVLGNISYAPYIIIIQLASAICVGIIFRFYKNNSNLHKKSGDSNQKDSSPKPLNKILNESIINAAYNTINIGGFIVFYSVLIKVFGLSNILSLLNNVLSPFENIIGINSSLHGKLAVGLFEISNGMNVMINSNGPIGQKLLILNIIINWGSFSVHSQTSNIIQNANISLKPYVLGKIMQTLFSIILTLLFLIIL